MRTRAASPLRTCRRHPSQLHDFRITHARTVTRAPARARAPCWRTCDGPGVRDAEVVELRRVPPTGAQGRGGPRAHRGGRSTQPRVSRALRPGLVMMPMGTEALRGAD